MDIEKVKKLDGKTVAMLEQHEIELLKVAQQTGRKHQINVNITINDVTIADLSQQLTAIVSGDRNVPMWRENSYISISSATEQGSK